MISDFMNKDYCRLKEIFEEFLEARKQDAGRAKEIFWEFKDALERHLLWEEETLIPFHEKLWGPAAGGSIALLREEHLQIRKFLVRMQNRILNGTIYNEEIECALTLALDRHRKKEESLIQPLIGPSASDPEKDAVLRRIRTALVWSACSGAARKTAEAKENLN